MELLIIAAIVISAVLSIVLGIINWVKLSAASSKISVLEEAVEKKTKEFDSLKKERQAVISHAEPPPLFPDGPESRDTSVLPQTLLPESSNAPIEVFRSSPTGFKNVLMEKINAPAPAPESEVLDVVDKHEIGNDPHLTMNEPVEIMLFSDMNKDTDFAAAWKKLTAHLAVTNRPSIVINFKNVLFLYNKELNYLEKMLDTIMKANGTVTFLHYHKELHSILSSRPALAGFLK
jgi:ABC-type antimicrobial peptide transport system permease subunit